MDVRRKVDFFEPIGSPPLFVGSNFHGTSPEKEANVTIWNGCLYFVMGSYFEDEWIQRQYKLHPASMSIFVKAN